MKLLRLLFLLGFILTTICKASVVSMEELYNPKLNQTILLIGDMHLIQPKDQEQHDALLNVAKKHNAHCIVETSEQIFKSPSLFTKEWQADLKKQLLVKFFNSCKEQEIRTADIEFRLAYAILLNLRGHIKYGELDKNTITKKNIYALFSGSFAECTTALEKIKKHAEQLKAAENPEYDLYATTIRKANDLTLEIYDSLPTKMADNDAWKSSIADFLMHDICETPGTQSILTKMDQLIIMLFDTCILIELFNQKDQPVIFVHAGYLHTKKISNFLKMFEYTSQNKISHGLEATENYLKLRTQKNLEHTVSSQEFEKYLVDVKNFIDSSSLSNRKTV